MHIWGKLEWEDRVRRRMREGLQLKLRTILGVVWKPTTVETSKNIYIYEGSLTEITE